MVIRQIDDAEKSLIQDGGAINNEYPDYSDDYNSGFGYGYDSDYWDLLIKF